MACALSISSGAAAGAPDEAAPPSGKALLQERVRVESEPLDFIEIDFVVEDRTGQPARGLGLSDFRLRVDGRGTPLESVSEARSQPNRTLSVALLLDVSGSMRGLQHQRFLLASQALLGQLRPSDEMMIMTFAEECQVLSDFTRNPEALRATFESIPRPNRGTDLYGALEEALDRLATRPDQRVVVLYSDGQATVGRTSLTATPRSLDVLDLTRRRPIPVYWIVPHFVDSLIVTRTPDLRNLVLGSGGRWILETEGIEKALIAVGRDLSSQYSASFFVDKRTHRRPFYQIDLEPRRLGFNVRAPRIVTGSGSLVRRLEEMLASDQPEERLAAASQFSRYGYDRACSPLLRSYRRENNTEVHDALLNALLTILRDEWHAVGEQKEAERDAARGRIERQLNSLEDPRALTLLQALRE